MLTLRSAIEALLPADACVSYDQRVQVSAFLTLVHPAVAFASATRGDYGTGTNHCQGCHQALEFTRCVIRHCDRA